MAKWRKFSREEIEEIVKNSNSTREVARKMGYSQEGGGTMASLKRMYEELNLDTSHFKGQGWNKGNYNYEAFEEFSYKKRGKTTAAPLIALRGQKCEKCGIIEWLGMPINLEVHHKDGDRTNNDLGNLMLLCPNCHSYTPTFARSGDKREKTDEEFIEALKSSKNIRQALIHLDLTPSGGNYNRAWELIYQNDIRHLMKQEP